MQPKPRQIHVFGIISRIKPAEDEPKPLGVSSLYTGSTAGLKKFGQSFVLEASYHP